ncbi:type II toxin-antitoxin system Phd/YefM family antitoxin [Bengtsoniella intestinalis]|uniref:type II toxin-antitoxin system Phd/YefM family antitoxin n=1 Tax=Bengtsoniella intestinalis TaxID=3073143 RepID=UPI00391EF685
MLESTFSVKSVMDSIVPITRFNRGEATKIFDEVHASGTKIVLKNNVPSCVLVEPGRYEAMVEALEDYALFFEAEKRLASHDGEMLSHDMLCAKLSITPEDLEDIEVEIE